MRRLSCCVLVLGALTASAAPAAGQAGERASSSVSSFERRASQFERREESRIRARAEKAGTPPASVFLARITPSIESTDSATKFSPALHLVQQTADGIGAFTFRTGFRTQRPRDTTKSRAVGGGVGADLQLTSDDNRFGVLVVSGDFVKVKDGFDLTIATAEFDRNIGERVTAIGTLAFGRLSPNGGDSVGDVIPGLALQVSGLGVAGAAVLGEYTFKNDLDEEDDFAFTVRFKLTDTSSLKVGTGKHGRVFASFVQVLRK
jgi:hypothetical protein